AAADNRGRAIRADHGPALRHYHRWRGIGAGGKAPGGSKGSQEKSDDAHFGCPIRGTELNAQERFTFQGCRFPRTASALSTQLPAATFGHSGRPPTAFSAAGFRS